MAQIGLELKCRECGGSLTYRQEFYLVFKYDKEDDEHVWIIPEHVLCGPCAEEYAYAHGAVHLLEQASFGLK